MTVRPPEPAFKFTPHDRDFVHFVLRLLDLAEFSQTKATAEPDARRAGIYDRVGIVLERAARHAHPSAVAALEKLKS